MTAIGCQYNMPSADAGVIDPDKVKVEYTPGSGGAPQELARANDAASCGPGGGWYYNNNANPTLILLCPATCNAVKADQKAGIQIALGCLEHGSVPFLFGPPDRAYQLDVRIGGEPTAHPPSSPISANQLA